MRRIIWGAVFAAAWGSMSCGGGAAAVNAKAGSGAEHPATPEEAEAATHTCGDSDKVHAHDLHAGGATQAFVPCAGAGKHDYSGLVRIETVENGVHIIIDARDDEVDVLGPDVKKRDAVIVYPKANDKKVAIEVPLMKTKTGYHGDKIVFWDDLDKLHDEGTKIDIAIYDHDKTTGHPAEELHVSINISTGKSCEKAQDENPQTVSFDKKDGKPDLSRDQLGAPIAHANVAVACGLPDASKAHICALVRNGKALGVTVAVDPKSNKVAACIDKKVRALSYPVSDKPDTLKFDY